MLTVLYFCSEIIQDIFYYLKYVRILLHAVLPLSFLLGSGIFTASLILWREVLYLPLQKLKHIMPGKKHITQANGINIDLLCILADTCNLKSSRIGYIMKQHFCAKDILRHL